MPDNQYIIFTFVHYHLKYFMRFNKKSFLITILFSISTQFLFAASFEKYFSKLIRFEGRGYGISKAVWGNKEFTKAEAMRIHKKHYWDKYHADLFKSQELAEVFIDHIINAGEGKGSVNIKALEAILGVKQDGILTKKDIKIANSFAFPEQVINPYVNYRLHYYNSRKAVKKYPGWITRAESFYIGQDGGEFLSDYLILPKILQKDTILDSVKLDNEKAIVLK